MIITPERSLRDFRNDIDSIDDMIISILGQRVQGSFDEHQYGPESTLANTYRKPQLVTDVLLPLYKRLAFKGVAEPHYQLDMQLLSLLDKRGTLSLCIGEVKKNAGLGITVQKREQQIEKRVKKTAQENGLPAETIWQAYQEIIFPYSKMIQRKCTTLGQPLIHPSRTSVIEYVPILESEMRHSLENLKNGSTGKKPFFFTTYNVDTRQFCVGIYQE